MHRSEEAAWTGFAVWAVFLFLANSAWQAEAVMQTAPKIDPTLLQGQVQEVSSLKKIPREILDVLANLTHSLKIADRGERYEVTDFITDPDLPRRRLRMAAHSDRLWLIHYDHGGYAPHSHVAGILLERGTARLAFVLVGFSNVETVSELIDRLRVGEKFPDCLVGSLREEMDGEDLVRCQKTHPSNR